MMRKTITFDTDEQFDDAYIILADVSSEGVQRGGINEIYATEQQMELLYKKGLKYSIKE
ncbi:MAG: hypothetical protein WAM14_17110 [Candidatus Nitrosopolaris sp.]